MDIEREADVLGRVVIVGAVFAALLLWQGPFSVPPWAMVAFFILVVLPAAVVLSVKRMRQESRVVRSLWRLLKRD